jgi:hypothetical protein
LTPLVVQIKKKKKIEEESYIDINGHGVIHAIFTIYHRLKNNIFDCMPKKAHHLASVPN